MTKKVRVQLFGHQRRGIDVDADATDGSVIGENLYLPDGTLVTQQMVINNSTTIITTGGPIAVSPTLWGLILDIPAFIQSLGVLSTNGLVTYVSGTAVARTIQGEVGRIDVTNGDAQAGDPTIELGDWPTFKNSVELGELATVPTDHQAICFEDFVLDGGEIVVDGELVILGVEGNVDIEYFDTIVMESDGNKGIKIGDEADSGYGWRDILGQIRQRGVGANDPSWSVISASALSGWKFALNDEVWIDFHMPHDYVPGTDIHFHTHWFSDGSNTNPVKWEWTFVYADGFDRQSFDFANPTTITAESAAISTTDHFLLPDAYGSADHFLLSDGFGFLLPDGASFMLLPEADFLLPDGASLLLLPARTHSHQITETDGVTIPGLEVDGMIYARVRRITNGATDNTDGIFVITSDVHYQSNNLATLNKAPNFYGP